MWCVTYLTPDDSYATRLVYSTADDLTDAAEAARKLESECEEWVVSVLSWRECEALGLVS